uniref:Uncharacterized protein n=1 Tax=Arundo donax TaxID=35708 RepID=A0A0A9G8H9_ARUDO
MGWQNGLRNMAHEVLGFEMRCYGPGSIRGEVSVSIEPFLLNHDCIVAVSPCIRIGYVPQYGYGRSATYRCFIVQKCVWYNLPLAYE